MRRFFLSGVTAFLLAAQAAPVSASLRTEYIYDNGGGRLVEFIAKKKQYARDGTSIEVHGRCESACTVYLSLPSDQICVAAGGYFGIHRPYFAEPVPSSLQRRADRLLMEQYPLWLRAWIKSTGGLKRNIVRVPHTLVAKYIKTCA